MTVPRGLDIDSSLPSTSLRSLAIRKSRAETNRVLFDHSGLVLLVAKGQHPNLMVTEYLVDNHQWTMEEVNVTQSQGDYSYISKVVIGTMPDYVDFDNDHSFAEAVWEQCEKGSLKLIAKRVKPDE